MDDTSKLEARLAARRDEPMQPHEAQALSDLRAKLFGKTPTKVTIARYELLEKIGSGGSGTVYRAFDPELDRTVAIKLLHGRQAKGPETTDARARLVREARAMAKLSHPNIVAVFDVGTYELGEGHQKGVFVVMELIEGRDLERWLETARGWQEVIDVFLAAGRGLAAAHASGIIHRDFKPANVLVGTDGTVRVADLGLATRISDDRTSSSHSGATSISSLDARLTSPGGIVGTPMFMAPEVLAGGTGDAKSDQFSFCVALFRALHRKRPFEADDLETLRRSIGRGTISSTSGDGARVPAAIDHVVARGLAVEPARRWADMDELLRALDRARHRRRRIAVGLGLAGVIAAASFGLVRTASEDPCAAVGEPIDAQWNSARERALSAVFERSDRGYAADAWTAVKTRVDTFAQRWRDERKETCHEMRTFGPSPGSERRVACLDDGLDELGTLLDILESLEDQELANAPDAAASLVDPADCREASIQDDATRPPDELAVEIDAVRKDLRRLKLLEEIGRFDEGLALSSEILDRGLAIDHVPLHAEALLRAGLAAMAKADYPTAEEHLRRGYFAALSSGHDRFGLANAVQLVALHGIQLGDAQQGRGWGEHARALAARSGGDGIQLGHLANNLGSVELGDGRYDEALPLLEEALAIHERELGPEDPEVANVLNNLGSVHYQLGRPDEGIAFYERAIALRRKPLGSRHPKLVSPMANLAALLHERGDTAAAEHLYRETIALAEDSLGQNHPSVVHPLGNLGQLLRARGDATGARNMMERALAVARQNFTAESPRLVGPLSNLGALELGEERLEDARTHLESARAIVERSLPPDHPAVVQLLVLLARLAQAEGQRQDALGLAEQALTAAERGSERALLEPLLALADIEQELQRREAEVNYRRAHELALAHPTAHAQRARACLGLARVLPVGDEAQSWIECARKQVSLAHDVELERELARFSAQK